MSDLRYPIGPFEPPGRWSPRERREAIARIAETPARLRQAVTDLSDAQLDIPYRPGGWTVRQLVHHIPDSHLNGYVRFKLALTEDEPTIRPFDQERWAELSDSTGPIDMSLALLDGLHRRWVLLLEDIPPEEWARTFHHPELGTLGLDALLSLYAWHGRHHVAHITSLRDREGW